ncbi:UDP-2,4-diacetamido-2,4,6-trideoxy-beta-L-altropyranose hydrolase [Christiangramia forsetii]|uniref:UDP-2,4-diacetamido-2,4, 6-trideoxy-beta-L-altropyranose hydrolase n=2 Tax=Christiangramia forsetii TaxID=411153 RepID=A0M2Z2_CHRFK|nr:UDP-2,4-diacetamido-2,4,6-trideoxy-beta-L-altropyranose hydrolase [Christiangramia forsetii]GGG27174.1 hypothetical protein GCM10011532_08250 [Christiangramia forsetii]CAL66987.1 conserved hypothetical protein [Christiangramia forsetii KT0803]
MKDKIYIRADGSPEIGLGHIIRCFALAKMLKGSFNIHFVTRSIPKIIETTFVVEGFSVSRISEEEEFFNFLNGDEIVVLDHYELDSTYQKRVKEIGSKLVCIDDLHDKVFFADLIINHSPGISPKDYLAQPYTKFALGPGYALLRPAFLEATKDNKKIDEIKHVLICFGGSDFKNLTKSVLEIVAENDMMERISVILGSAYTHHESLNDIEKKNPKIKISSSLNENEMLSEIKKADLAIIPSSGILLEVLAGGAIPLICYYAENQQRLFNYFKYRDLLPSFDANKFDGKELSTVIADIQNNKIKIEEIPFRKELRNAAKNNLKKFKKLVNE